MYSVYMYSVIEFTWIKLHFWTKITILIPKLHVQPGFELLQLLAFC